MSQRSYCPPQTRSTIPRRSRWRSRTPHQRDNASSTTRQPATNDAQRPKSRAVDAQRQNAIDNANVAVPAIERVLHCERRANIAAPRHAMDFRSESEKCADVQSCFCCVDFEQSITSRGAINNSNTRADQNDRAATSTT